MKRYSFASAYGMTCTERVQLGASPRSIASKRSRRWKSASDPAIRSAASLVRPSTPCWVWKWYFTQYFSPSASTHMYVCEP